MRRVRDGRRFVQRQVSGYQRGREIVLATVSFTTDSADAVGFQHERMGPKALARRASPAPTAGGRECEGARFSHTSR